MQLQQLRFFVAAAKAENISRAAQSLFVSQPNLSLSIKKLEESLGVALFNHRKGKVTLTPGGQIFLEYAERALAELDAGVQAAQNIARVENHQIRMATPLPDLLAKVLPGYVQTHPHVSVRQFNFTNSQCLEALESGAVDLAVVFSPVESGKLAFEAVDSSPLVVMVGEQHPLAGAGCLTLAQLDGAKCVCNLSRGDNRFFDRLAERDIRPQIICECDNDSVELSVLRSGMALSVCAQRNYKKLCRDHAELPLRMLSIADATERAAIGCACRRGYQRSPELQELIRQLTAKLVEDGD